MGYLLVLRIAGVNFTPAYVEQIQRLPDILSIHRLGQQRIWICHDLSRNIAPQNPKLHHVSSKIAREMSGFLELTSNQHPAAVPESDFFPEPAGGSTGSTGSTNLDLSNQSRELQKPGATPKKWCLNLGSWADLNK